jgi:hypothetical protein
MHKKSHVELKFVDTKKRCGNVYNLTLDEAHLDVLILISMVIFKSITYMPRAFSLLTFKSSGIQSNGNLEFKSYRSCISNVF